jgi:hypothetical protein
MNWFLTSLIILFSFGIFFILLFYIANYLVKPRWPEWWSKNISELDPDDLLVGNTRRKRFTTKEFGTFLKSKINAGWNEEGVSNTRRKRFTTTEFFALFGVKKNADRNDD